MTSTKIAALMLMLLMVFATIPMVAAEDTEIPDGEDTEDDSSEMIPCTDAGGEAKSNFDDTKMLCFFPDDSVCDIAELSSSECSAGECLATCDSTGTRTEGWYDCNDNLLVEEDCEDDTSSDTEVEDEDGTETEDEDDGELEDTEAEEEDEQDVETEDELAAIISPYGAEVRLLQLQKSLNKNILEGQEIVNYILENDSEADVTELNTILAEMQDLLSEIEATPTEGTGEELAQAYVDLKSDAIELTKQFREAARELLPAGERNKLMPLLAALKNQEMERLEAKIMEAKHNYNVEQVSALLESLGIEDEELLAAVEDGTASKDDIKDAVESALEGMTEEEKEEALLKLREALSKKAVSQKAMIENAIANRFERQIQRWEERSEKFQNKSQEAKANAQPIKERVMTKLSEVAQNRSEDLQEKEEQFQEKIQERLGERQGTSGSSTSGSGAGTSGAGTGSAGNNGNSNQKR